MRPLDGGEQPIHQDGEMSAQLKHVVKKRLLLEETEGELGQILGALMSMLVNNRGLLGYPATSSPRDDDIMPVCGWLCMICNLWLCMGRGHK
jgi:hypothetical protein